MKEIGGAAACFRCFSLLISGMDGVALVLYALSWMLVLIRRGGDEGSEMVFPSRGVGARGVAASIGAGVSFDTRYRTGGCSETETPRLIDGVFEGMDTARMF